MKKLIFGIAMILAAASAVPALAAPAKENKCNKQQTECCKESCNKQDKKCKKQGECTDAKKCDKQNCDKQKCDKQKCDKKGKKGGDRQAGLRDKKDGRMDLFEGITLTENQIVEINNLRADNIEKRAAAKAEMIRKRTDFGKMTDEQKAEAKADMDARKAETRKANDEAMSKILTPEQYAKYQENVKAAQARKAEKKAAKAEKRGHKDGAKRDNRQAQSDNA